MAKFTYPDAPRRPELDDPSVTPGENNDLVNYPNLSLQEIRSLTPGARDSINNTRAGQATAAAMNGRGRSGPLAGALTSPRSSATGLGSMDSAGTLKQFGRSTGLGAMDASGTLKQDTPGVFSIPGSRKDPVAAVSPVGPKRQLPSDEEVAKRIGVTAPAPGSGVGMTARGTAAAAAEPGNPLSQLKYAPTPEPGVSGPTNVYEDGSPTPSAVPGPTFQNPSYQNTPEVKEATLPNTTYGNAPTALPAPSPTPSATPSATPAATPPAHPMPTEGGGRLVAAGVSNSQAAKFETPTKENPIPKTPTSPVMDVEDYDKQPKSFAGFK